MKRALPLLALALVFFLPDAALAAAPAASNSLSIDLSGGGLFTDRMMQIIALITILSVAPSILIMMTCFVRMVVVLSLLRTAMGVQTTPPNSVIVSLALFLTLFVMTPTMKAAYEAGIVPLMNQQITTDVALERASVPVKEFMLAHVRDADLKLFLDMAHAKAPKERPMSRSPRWHPPSCCRNSSAPSRSDSCSSCRFSSSTWPWLRS